MSIGNAIVETLALAFNFVPWNEVFGSSAKDLSPQIGVGLATPPMFCGSYFTSKEDACGWLIDIPNYEEKFKEAVTNAAYTGAKEGGQEGICDMFKIAGWIANTCDCKNMAATCFPSTPNTKTKTNINAVPMMSLVVLLVLCLVFSMFGSMMRRPTSY